MLNQRTLLISLLFCLTISLVSTFEASLTKSYFFVDYNNQLPYKLFHTNYGIIAYSVETVESQLVPQYILLDYKSGFVRFILSDITSSCNHTGPVVFDRLHYHAQTSTLVYYCTANNSLLVLDEQNYTVQAAIPTQLNETFAEAKLSADGNVRYVLAMGSLYTSTQASQLIKIDLSSREVLDTIVFNQNLADGEIVNGFLTGVQAADTSQQAFILTNSLNGTTATVNIYHCNFGDNAYYLQLFTHFSYRIASDLPTFDRTVNLLFSVGEYIVTNNNTDLVFFDPNGEVAYKIPSLYPKIIMMYGPCLYLPAFIEQEGGQELYALFVDRKLVKFAVVDDIITTEVIGDYQDMQIAYGGNQTHNLLLTTSTDMLNFTIRDLNTSQVMYSTLAHYGTSTGDNSLIITNSTYCVLLRDSIYIFDLESNTLLTNDSQLWTSSVHQDRNLLYYIGVDQDTDTCQLTSLDLTTGIMKVLYEYSEMEECFGTIIYLKNSASGFPEHVLASYEDTFLIVSEKFGAVTFDLFTGTGIVVPDFDTMSVYHLDTPYSGNTIDVIYYEYDNATGFLLKDSYNFSNISVLNFYYIGDEKVVVTSSEQYFTLIDLQFGSATRYSSPTIPNFMMSWFEDLSHRKHLIFSDVWGTPYWSSKVTPPSMFDSNGVSEISGTNNYTVQTGSAGLCSYWVVDKFMESVELVKFYNACSEQVEEKTGDLFSILEY